MSEYWKSTPSYWCKFCHTYVRDTGLERKNHESSIKHQNNIQRSLRELHKGKEREDREKQRAKDEVARLNGLVGGQHGNSASTGTGGKIIGIQSVAAAPIPKANAAAQRKAHAEQLAALGVELPDELKREVTGVGGWQTVSEHVVEDDQAATGRSLADIIKQEGESKEDVKEEVALSRGVHKRKADEEEEEAEAARKRLAWGSKLKSYPGAIKDEGREEDLDALLSGVKKKPEVIEQEAGEADAVKREATTEREKSTSDVSHVDASMPVKQDDDAEAVAPVMFKKRKVKK